MITSRLISRVPEIIAVLPGKVDGALEEAAEAIAEGAKERVPVDTGALRDAIHIEKREHGWAVVAGDTDAYYGHIVEHGSSAGGKGRPPQPPRPFLIPAAEAEGAETIDRIEEAMEDV